jgi:hypothetical protein
MNLYRVWCRFEPDHLNMATGRRGQWRVMKLTQFHDGAPLVHTGWDYQHGPVLTLASTKHYPRGCIIRPHKELNRVLEARRHHDH